MSDGTSESWSGVEPASPAPRRPRFVKVRPSCGASWTAIRGFVVDTIDAACNGVSKCQACGGIADGVFVPDHDGRSRPLWDEERHRWRWASPAECEAHDVEAWP